MEIIYTSKQIKEKYGLAPTTAIKDCNISKLIEYRGFNAWAIRRPGSDKRHEVSICEGVCVCPQGSLCEFFDKKVECCLYGKI